MSNKPVKLSFRNMVNYRNALGMNQSEFWKRFGVTQSGGSRYERARDIPKPVQLLLALTDLGIVTDESLEKARKVIAKANQ